MFHSKLLAGDGEIYRNIKENWRIQENSSIEKMFHNTIIKNVIKNNLKRFLSVKVMGDESAFNNVHKVIKNNSYYYDCPC